MVKDSAEIIQAFPVHPHTYVGSANSFDPRGYSIVHVVEDSTVTFNFGTSGSVVLEASAGQDLAIGDFCVGITSTATVWIS